MLLIKSDVAEALAKPTKTLKLLVWYDADDQEVKYVYGDRNGVDFGGGAGPQTLNIELISVDPVSPTNPAPRFELAYFTATTISKIQQVTPFDQTGGAKAPQKGHESALPPGTRKAKFDLMMAAQDSFYIDIIVKDNGEHANKGRLICCDPQVENGTKTK